MNNCILKKYPHRTSAVLAAVFALRLAANAQAMPSQSMMSSNVPPAPESFVTTMTASAGPADEVPDAPLPQNQTSDKDQKVSEHDQTHINSIPLLSPRLNAGTVLSPRDKWQIYYHKTYSPAAIIYPLFGAGIKMANPKKNYPREWKDGMGAFGRNYGNEIAQRTARSTADFSTQVLLHEDPRYQRSESKNAILRVGHALTWTFVDKSDSGHRTFALSTFTSSAAGGFVGMAYLPDGYNDVTHAEQRMLSGVGGRAIANILTEFEPLWGPWAAKLRVPKLLPEWWIHQPKR